MLSGVTKETRVTGASKEGGGGGGEEGGEGKYVTIVGQTTNKER